MGFFRFRRSVKLFPGVRLNFGKRSSSLSFGVKGAHYTVGTAGSRTTFGIPGTGLSYTDIYSSHARVASRHPSIPTPSDSWVRNNRVNVTIHTPDRGPDEAPIRPDQLDTIKSITPDFDLSKVSGFGEVQAESLIEQLRFQPEWLDEHWDDLEVEEANQVVPKDDVTPREMDKLKLSEEHHLRTERRIAHEMGQIRLRVMDQGLATQENVDQIIYDMPVAQYLDLAGDFPKISRVHFHPALMPQI
jgi:hypothetical protein